MQVNTNVQQASASEFYLALDEVESINHVVVFLTGQVPFSEGFGGSIYFGWPVGEFPVTCFWFLVDKQVTACMHCLIDIGDQLLKTTREELASSMICTSELH